MKQYLLPWLPFFSSLLISIYGSILRLMRKVGLIKVLDSSALILPPSAPGSLGDEAMVVASVEYLRKQGINQIGLVAYHPRQQYSVTVEESINLRDYFIFGSAQSFIKKFIQFGYRVSRYERHYCLGADLMDGYYSDYATFKKVKLIELAAKAGLETAILGFSFNEKPTSTAVKVLRGLPSHTRLCARDPISQERLDTHLNRPIQLVADLAFLLHPAQDSDKVSQVHEWISEQRKQDRIIVGINANNLLVKDSENSTPQFLIQAYVNHLQALFSENSKISFLLISHDFRKLKGMLNDDNLAQEILQALPSEMQPYSFRMPNPYTSSEVKAVVKELDIVLSGRMHLAIACLGQAVPIVCVTYQGKFEGLFKHFELEGMAITPDGILASESAEFTKRFLHLIEVRENTHKHIKEKLPAIQQLALANFGNS